jgi:hypothetical protein
MRGLRTSKLMIPMPKTPYVSDYQNHLQLGLNLKKLIAFKESNVCNIWFYYVFK